MSRPRTGERGDPVATHVNLDALIPREDFEVTGGNMEATIRPSVQISDLESGAFFYQALRKPDFQRETAEWEPERVVGLIRTFINGDLIPGVILWKNRDLLFAIDGAHRLSALIAWVQDDYGDGERSQLFFNHTIPDAQKRIAKRTRQLVEKEFGSYKDHKAAVANREGYGPDIIQRALSFGSLSVDLQWVRGDSVKAEASFKRINQQQAKISDQELELLDSRKQPGAIAARAILRRGTGHKYWSPFAPPKQSEIEELATDLHKLVFSPGLEYPIKTVDLPIGGQVYSATALRMVYDLVNLSVGPQTPTNDADGTRTIEYLKRTRRVTQLLLSNEPRSLGLHPAVYCYSWTGKQQPVLFLVLAELLIELDRTNRLDEFTECRKELESFLMNNRALINQLVRKFGTKNSGNRNLRRFYETVLSHLKTGATHEKLIDLLRADPLYSYLQPGESPYDGSSKATKFSKGSRSGIAMKELLKAAPRCGICGGVLPFQALSVDHIKRREDGGLAVPDNAQLSHPYCNTGYKEHMAAAQKKATKK
jgi:hypothetical protein